MAPSSILQKQENVEIIDLTMDCSSDDDYCCSVINEFTTTDNSYMDLDEIECFRDEEEVEEYDKNEQQNFFDEGITESDIANGRYYFDVDNGFYRYNEQYSNNDNSERFFCYRNDDEEEEFFEKEPENTSCENYDDLFFTGDFSVLASFSKKRRKRFGL